MEKVQHMDDHASMAEEQGLIIVSGSLSKLGVVSFANS